MKVGEGEGEGKMGRYGEQKSCDFIAQSGLFGDRGDEARGADVKKREKKHGLTCETMRNRAKQ